jgi:hypothetical protein
LHRTSERIKCGWGYWDEALEVEAEDLIQDLQRLIPVPGRGQRLGEVPGDRRRDLPAQAELPGPGQAVPAGADGQLVLAAALPHVTGGEVRPRLKVPGADARHRGQRASQRRARVLAVVRPFGGQQHRGLGPELRVGELVSEVT